MLKIKQTNKDGIVEMALIGRLDSTTSLQFEDAVKAAIPEAKGMILDFRRLKYISSAGIRVLLYLLRTAKFDNKIVIKNCSEQVETVLDFVGISEHFSMQHDH